MADFFNMVERDNLLSQALARQTLLTKAELRSLSPGESFKRLLTIISEVGVARGPLLKIWPFNMYPQTEVLDLGARIVVRRLTDQYPEIRKLQTDEIIIGGIETAGVHWTSAFARALSDIIGLESTPPILRIHKKTTIGDEAPSISSIYPRGEVLSTPVNSITSRVGRRESALTETPTFDHLAMHNPGFSFLRSKRVAFIADDFQATLDTTRKGSDLVRECMRVSVGREVDIFFLAIINKKDQAEIDCSDIAQMPLLNVVDFQEGPNAFFEIEGYGKFPLLMHRNGNRSATPTPSSPAA